MTTSAWRSVLLVLCAVCAIGQVAGLVDILGAGGAPPWYGMWGADFVASGEPYHLRELAVDPSGAAYHAGIREGDIIDVRPTTLVDRIGEIYQPLSGRPVVVSISRGALTTRERVVPQGFPPDDLRRWRWALGAFTNVWILLFAALIVWRRAVVSGNLLLAGALILYVGFGLSVTPWAWLYGVLSLLGTCTHLFAIALWAAFAGRFATPLTAARRAAQWLCFALIGIAGAGGLLGLFALITLKLDPVPFFFAPVWTLPHDGAVFMAMTCSALAIAASRGVERQRAVWALVPLAVLYALAFAYTTYYRLSSSYSSTVVVLWVATSVSLVVPVALSYAAVSRRVIDVGFVLNRTVIFAFVSVIVIGAFFLVEWAAGAWLAGATRATSAVIGMAVAMALGLSLRYIERYVERFVDRVFFWKRHADEAALRRFAHESSYINDRSVLLARTEREVKDHTGAESAAILVRDGAASYVSASNGERVAVSENDPGIVAMRAWHKAVDLHSIPGTELRGEYAFPMVSRGELVGALVCGSKPDGELYAPDESDALLALAHGVGATLDTLSSRTDNAVESVREKLDVILKQQEALLTQVKLALPPTAP
jgi:hypothetical protein